jgi:hypothetical protein
MEREVQVRHVSLEINADFESFTQTLGRFDYSLSKDLETDPRSPRASMSSPSAVSKERLEKQPWPSMYPAPTSGPSVRGISNDCVLSPTPQCWPMRWVSTELFQLSFNVFALQEQHDP